MVASHCACEVLEDRNTRSLSCGEQCVIKIALSFESEPILSCSICKYTSLVCNTIQNFSCIMLYVIYLYFHPSILVTVIASV
jgi:hypothetical protein